MSWALLQMYLTEDLEQRFVYVTVVDCLFSVFIMTQGQGTQYFHLVIKYYTRNSRLRGESHVRPKNYFYNFSFTLLETKMPLEGLRNTPGL